MNAEGWVLAGGRSVRMGRDKAGVALAGRPLLEHMLDKLRALGVRARVAGLHAPIAGVDAEVLRDAHPDCGPLSGMETALAASEAALVLVAGVDLPLLEVEFLAWMLERAATTGAMATVPRVGGMAQPLCAVYRRELLSGVTEALNAGDYKMMVAVERAARSGRLDGGGIDFFDAERVAATGAWHSMWATHVQFMNCNTPEELAAAEVLLARKHVPNCDAGESLFVERGRKNASTPML
jgi:molybdopterin-guanine dinucleotide biosynthesis protein A